jgi:hypothetical protein
MRKKTDMHNIDIHGYPVALGAVCFVIGAVLWRYKKLHRISGIGFLLGAFFLAVGVIPWLDALAALTATGTGVVVLLIADVVSGFGTWYEVIKKHMHHRIRTPVLCVAFGTSVVVTIGSLSRLLHEAATSPAKTTAALSQTVAQIKSGSAAHAMSGHQPLVILGVAALVMIVLIAAASRMEKTSGSGRGTAAIPGRRPVTGRPAARTALPRGRR